MRDDQRGEMLIELLMSVAILGIVVAGALGGLGSAVIGYKEHRRSAQVDTLVRAFAEQTKRQVQLQHTIPYSSCAAAPYPIVFSVPPDYDPALYPMPTITQIEVLTPSLTFKRTYSSSGLPLAPCSAVAGNPNFDIGAQRVTVAGRIKVPAGPPVVNDNLDTFQIIVRRP